MLAASCYSSFQGRQLGNLSPTNFSRQLHHTVYKRLSHHIRMEDHTLNVKTSLNFNMSGDLLASSGDHPDIPIWDWANGEKKVVYKSGHSGGVRQVKQKLMNCDIWIVQKVFSSFSISKRCPLFWLSPAGEVYTFQWHRNSDLWRGWKGKGFLKLAINFESLILR